MIAEVGACSEVHIARERKSGQVPGLTHSETAITTNGTAGRTQRGDGSLHFVGWWHQVPSVYSLGFHPSIFLIRPVGSIFYLCWLVRRPRLILDFTATLVFNHVVLTTYYSAALPSSLFFWLVVLLGAAATVSVTEQLCVRREMREGLQTTPVDADEIELGQRGPIQGSRID